MTNKTAITLISDLLERENNLNYTLSVYRLVRGYCGPKIQTKNNITYGLFDQYKEVRHENNQNDTTL